MRCFYLRLRFAASQWQLLVTNAETLLNELAISGLLGDDTKNKIESWLCLKEEYANCIDPELLAIKPRTRIQVDSSGSQSVDLPIATSTFQTSCESKTLHVIGNTNLKFYTIDTSTTCMFYRGGIGTYPNP